MKGFASVLARQDFAKAASVQVFMKLVEVFHYAFRFLESQCRFSGVCEPVCQRCENRCEMTKK